MEEKISPEKLQARKDQLAKVLSKKLIQWHHEGKLKPDGAKKKPKDITN